MAVVSGREASLFNEVIFPQFSEFEAVAVTCEIGGHHDSRKAMQVFWSAEHGAGSHDQEPMMSLVLFGPFWNRHKGQISEREGFY